ncbi:MAG: transglutaminase-like domain-containing protein [Hyphomicrobium sp.]
MLIHVGYDITLEVAAPTPVNLLLDIHPCRHIDIALEDWQAQPATEVQRGRDLYGNVMRRFVVAPGLTRLSYRAVVRDSGLPDRQPVGAFETPIAELPDACLHFLAGSRYCETDELSVFAWNTFGKIAPGYARVQAICDFVHNHIRFDYQNARSTRTALGAYNEGTGVCRDFAHLAIALTRCLNIPARYVNGFMGDIGVPVDPAPMDFCAWFEAYIGGEWVTFDARHNHPRIGRIVIARGRDAADVPMVTSFGAHRLAEFTVVAEEVAPSPSLTLSRAA